MPNIKCNIKKILITGGAGFLGSKLATKLVFDGFEVTVVDKQLYSNNSLDHLIPSQNFNFVNGDVRDKILMRRLLKNKDFVIPLAALVGAPLCEKYKKLATETNLNAISFITKNIKKSTKIIFPSTESGYGKTKKNIICNEKTPVNPISHYGKTKLASEKIVLNRRNSVVLRLGTVFGISYRFRQDLLVNNLVTRAIKDKKLEIFEGNYRRNFISIEDVINTFIYIINNFNNFKNEIFNVGLGDGNVTKIELAKLIKKEIKNLKIINNKSRKDQDQRDYSVSSRKLEKRGYKPKVKLSVGIKQLVEYLNKKNYSNNYNY
jgi:nucleoside-diphosphate-sugar epimerase